jgi:hypothetical protein
LDAYFNTIDGKKQFRKKMLAKLKPLSLAQPSEGLSKALKGRENWRSTAQNFKGSQGRSIQTWKNPASREMTSPIKSQSRKDAPLLKCSKTDHFLRNRLEASDNEKKVLFHIFKKSLHKKDVRNVNFKDPEGATVPISSRKFSGVLSPGLRSPLYHHLEKDG